MRLRGPLLLFAARDLMRRPGEAALTAIALAAIALAAAVPLLFQTALEQTVGRVFAGAPSLVIRRLEPGGFAPIPADEGLAALRSVRGVTEARARRWGVVLGPAGPLTVVGADEAARRALESRDIPVPAAGEVVVGTALAHLAPGARLDLRGPSRERTFRVAGALPRGSDLAGHDLVLVSWDDAAELLGLAPGGASDLAAWVYHQSEEEAIRADLAEALPWPVRITGRTEGSRALLGALSRDAAVAQVALVPALLALALLILAADRLARSRRPEVALLKALGWTTGEVLAWRLLGALAVGLPAIVFGLAAAYGLVLWPGAPGLLSAGVGWSEVPPDLALDPSGAVVVLAGVAGGVLAPWLGASLWPLIRSATADPGELLDGGGEG